MTTTRTADMASRSLSVNASTVGRAVAAAGVLLSADVHLVLYFEGFGDISVVGPAFLLNAVGGLAIGLAVLVWRSWLPLLAAIGFGIATLVAFYLSATMVSSACTRPGVVTSRSWQKWPSGRLSSVPPPQGSLNVGSLEARPGPTSIRDLNPDGFLTDTPECGGGNGAVQRGTDAQPARCACACAVVVRARTHQRRSGPGAGRGPGGPASRLASPGTVASERHSCRRIDPKLALHGGSWLTSGAPEGAVRRP